MSESQNQTPVTDEQVEEQIKELHVKENKTQEDSDKLEGLKKEKQTRYQKRIDTLTYEKRSAQERAEERDTRIKELEEELKARPKSTEPIRVSDDTVEVGGEKHYTYDSLTSMVASGKMTNAEADKLDRLRTKAELRVELKEDRIKEDESRTFKDIRVKDQEKVLRDHPQFDTRHRDFNPNDPLYKEANEIFQSGYYVKADGLSKAIQQAKKVLGMVDGKIDNSKNTNMYSPSAPNKATKQAEPLTDDQKEFAWRTYRDIKNPRTQRNYTNEEAITKYQQAIADRQR